MAKFYTTESGKEMVSMRVTIRLSKPQYERLLREVKERNAQGDDWTPNSLLSVHADSGVNEMCEQFDEYDYNDANKRLDDED